MKKCPSCNGIVTTVTYEVGEPSSLFGGSKSFVAVAGPCNHVIGAMPMTWESMMNEILQKTLSLENQLSSVEQKYSQLISIIDDLNRRIR